MNIKKLTENKTRELFVRFRKENDIFDDLLSERDKIVRIMEIHSITMDALSVELEKWDARIDKDFGKLLSQYKKNLKKLKEKTQ